jgi:tetratricopeptide (TPR) repeat protein
MTEALITDLAKISALRVISRTSVMQYKGAHKSLPQIAQELNVEAVVEGSVLRVGERVRISAQLVHAGSDIHVWAESYERDLRDVLAIQAEVAQAIAAEIRVQVTPRERKQLRSVLTVDPKAHEAYLLGRFHWNKRTLESLGKALEHFQQAVNIDPNYALAHAGIADAYVVLGGAPYERVSPHEAMPKALVAARKALQINESLGEAHATLAFINWLYKREWKVAEDGFLRALRLSPGYSTAYQWYGVYLAHLCRTTEALAMIERARELDPLSLQINTAVVQVLYFGRAYDRAVEQALRTLELDSAFPTTHMMLSLVYIQKGMPAEALMEAEKAEVYSGRSPATLACIGGCYAALGKADEATRVIQELKELSKEKHVSPYLMGWVYACLRNNDTSMHYLEQAYANGSTYLALIKGDPALDSLRSDARFQDLQRLVGLA